MTNKKTLTIGGLPIDVLQKSNLKNMYIRVNPPEGIVTASIPNNVDDETLRNFVLCRMPDIIKVRDRMLAQRRQSKREYVSGESCYLWGKAYMLQVSYDGNRYIIEKTPNKILMTAPVGATPESREKAMTEWYRAELKRVIPNILQQCEDRIGIDSCSCTVKYMKTRWGSCNIQNRHILVNLQLVKKPIECLEYVLTHELVHLIEANHTNLFRSLVEKYCPNWKEAKQLLEEMPLDYIRQEDVDSE